MKALASPQILHAALESSMPSLPGNSEGRSLWRVDKLNNSLHILLLSAQKPDFTHIIEQFGWPASDQTWETKVYDAFLNRIQVGQHWHFRLRANPVRSIKDGSNPAANRGKIVPCSKIDDQKLWLASRSLSRGFNVLSASDGNMADKDDVLTINAINQTANYTFEIVHRETKKFKRQGKTVTLNVATFEGILEVTDAEKFVHTLRHGLGRAKAYGCGLLTIAKLT
jgi:CRISPR system Cascade subunit CasE